jgi:uncharacterized membrane protein YdbT with pleckstrin-like domain
MSYIKANLNSGEKINNFTKPSIKPVIVQTVILLPVIFFSSYVIFEGATIASIIGTVLIVGLILVFEMIKIYVSEFAITNKRVISKLGLIRRDVEEMNLKSIESVNLKQSIIGRILNYGSIIISGRGSSQVTFKDIDDPVLIRKKIKHKS